MIRKAIISDIPQITTLLFELNKFHQENLPNDYKLSEEIAKKIDINDYMEDGEKIALVASVIIEKKEKVVGFILGDIWERKSLILKDRRIANIADILIDKNFKDKALADNSTKPLKVK